MGSNCKGCVCSGCKKSPKNGDVYGCPRKRCKACQDKGTNIKLTYCEECIPIDEGGELPRL